MGKITAGIRSWRRALGVAAAMGLGSILGASAADAAAPSLQWKFKAGEALHYQMEQKTVTEVKGGAGQDITTTVNQTMDTTWTVKSVDAATGSAEMIQTIDRIKTKIESPFGTFEYDSKEAKEPVGQIAASVVPMLKAIVGAKFEYKMSVHGELSDVKVPPGLINSLKEANPAGSGVTMFSEDGLKNMINESSLLLPAGPLEKPWTRQTKIPSPPIGSLVLDKTYKYDGSEAGSEKIALDVIVKLEPDDKAKAPFDIKLGEQEGKGTFLFDNNLGRVVSSKVSEKIQLLINVMDNKTVQKTDTSTSMKLLKPDAVKESK